MKRHLRLGTFFVMLLLAATCIGCTTYGHRSPSWQGVQSGERIGVLPLTDWQDDPDGAGSGRACQAILVQELGTELSCQVKSCELPTYDPKRPIDTQEATAAVQGQSVEYVVYGQCINFHRVAPMTFRPERGGMALYVADTRTGGIVYSSSFVVEMPNYMQPEDCIRRLAEGIAEEMTPE